MKITKGIGLIVFSLIVILLAVVPAGQAREMTPAEIYDLTKPEAKPARVYEPAQFEGTWGVAPDLLVNCDPDGGLLASLEPGRALSSHALNAAACQKQAVIDVEQEAASANAAYSGGSCGYTGVSGDTRMLKIAPVYTSTRFVYLQCGKKVGEFGPPSCSCGGNWRYTYDCKKPPTVYITIPCR